MIKHYFNFHFEAQQYEGEFLIYSSKKPTLIEVVTLPKAINLSAPFFVYPEVQPYDPVYIELYNAIRIGVFLKLDLLEIEL